MSLTIINEYHFLRLSHEDQLALCAKKVANFRQTSTTAKIIALCVSEPIAAKQDKVSVNTIAMLNFLAQSDQYLSNYLMHDRRELVQEAFDYFGVSKSTRAKLAEELTKDIATTVEMNEFTHSHVLDGVNRINSLPECVKLHDKLVGLGIKRQGSKLFNMTDLRELALIHYSLLSRSDKMTAISNVNHYCGHLLTRMNPSDISKKSESPQG